MKVYRITTTKWANQFTGSGFPARWNSKGVFVIYSASTRALACLENLVHRKGEGLNENFRVISIDIPEDIQIDVIDLDLLPANWTKYQKMKSSQQIGDDWYKSHQSCILQVPSSIIPEEHNYLIHTRHKDFLKIKITRIEPFLFDARLKN